MSFVLTPPPMPSVIRKDKNGDLVDYPNQAFNPWISLLWSWLDQSSIGGVLGVTGGGTGTSTAFTQGSVVFAGASGIYSQDNAHFFYDVGQQALGLGGSPGSSVQLRLTGTIPVGSFGVYQDVTIPVSGGTNGVGFYIAPTLNKSSGSSHNDFASVIIIPPTIGAGTSTLTNSTSLKITGAPTVGDNRRALWIAGGLTQLAAATTSDASLRLPHGTAPSVPVDGDAWTATTGIYSQINTATINLSHFTQAGANPNIRIFQTKARDLFSVSDSTSQANALTDIASATGGGVLLIPAAVSATFPSNTNSVVFEYNGPNIAYSPAATSLGGTSQAKAGKLFIASPGTHTDSNIRYTVGIVTNPVGATSNAVLDTDEALSICAMKQSWETTSVVGQVGGIFIQARGGCQATYVAQDGDVSMIQGDVMVSSDHFGVVLEANSYHGTSGSQNRQINVQLGVIDQHNSNYIGYMCNAVTGASSDAFRAQGIGGWTNFFIGYDTSNAVAFKIISPGSIYSHSASPYINLENTDATAGASGYLQFGYDALSSQLPVAKIKSYVSDGGGAGARAGHLDFFTSLAGAIGTSPDMRLSSDGYLGIGTYLTTTTVPARWLDVRTRMGVNAPATNYIDTQWNGLGSGVVPVASSDSAFLAVSVGAGVGTTHALLGGVQTTGSVAGNYPIGVLGLAIQNNAAAVNNVNTLAAYFETQITTQVGSAISGGVEIDVTNLSGTAATVRTPFTNTVTLNGITVAKISAYEMIGNVIVSGGSAKSDGEVAAFPKNATAAIFIGNNDAQWDKGIIFGAGGLSGGYLEALALPNDYSVSWLSAASAYLGYLHSNGQTITWSTAHPSLTPAAGLVINNCNGTTVSGIALNTSTVGPCEMAFNSSGYSSGLNWIIRAGAAGGFSWIESGNINLNVTSTGAGTFRGAFGCNGATAQTAVGSGGALAGYVTGGFGMDSDLHMHDLYNLAVAIRAALVANGIMS